MGPEASAKLRRESSRLKKIAHSRPLTVQEATLAFFHVAPKTFQTVAVHPESVVKHMMDIAGRKFQFEVLPDPVQNPPSDWHQKRHDIYAGRLADDLKAGHGGGADYWQGATSAEASAMAWHQGQHPKIHPNYQMGLFGRLYQQWRGRKANYWLLYLKFVYPVSQREQPYGDMEGRGECHPEYEFQGDVRPLPAIVPDILHWTLSQIGPFGDHLAKVLGVPIDKSNYTKSWEEREKGGEVAYYIQYRLRTEEDAILASGIAKREFGLSGFSGLLHITLKNIKGSPRGRIVRKYEIRRNPRRIFSILYRLWLKAKGAVLGRPVKMPWIEKGVYWGLAVLFPDEEGWENFAGYSAHELGQDVNYADATRVPGVVTIGFTFPTEEDAILAASMIQRVIYQYKITPVQMKIIQAVHGKISHEYDPLAEEY